MLRLEEIRRCISTHVPLEVSRDGMSRAAVALVLRGPAEAPDILFIKRASREGDPWSGQMAFPGGRYDPTDESEKDTAIRETEEEVGLSLWETEFLGRIDDLRGRPTTPSGGIVVSAHVYSLPSPPPLTLNAEVAEAFWFPLSDLLEPRRQVQYNYPGQESMVFPGLVVGDPERHVVWGLTYRFLEIFLEIAGHPLGTLPSDLDRL